MFQTRSADDQERENDGERGHDARSSKPLKRKSISLELDEGQGR